MSRRSRHSKRGLIRKGVIQTNSTPNERCSLESSFDLFCTQMRVDIRTQLPENAKVSPVVPLATFFSVLKYSIHVCFRTPYETRGIPNICFSSEQTTCTRVISNCIRGRQIPFADYTYCLVLGTPLYLGPFSLSHCLLGCALITFNCEQHDEVSRKILLLWRNLSPRDRKYWNKLADNKNQRYLEEHRIVSHCEIVEEVRQSMEMALMKLLCIILRIFHVFFSHISLNFRSCFRIKAHPKCQKNHLIQILGLESNTDHFFV